MTEPQPNRSSILTDFTHWLRSQLADLVAPKVHPVRVLNNDGAIRSLSCIVDKTGAAGHVCKRRDGRLLYYAEEDCWTTARIEILQAKFGGPLTDKQTAYWTSMVNEAVGGTSREAEIVAELQEQFPDAPWMP